MIFFRDGGDWSASSSVFYWLIDTLAAHAEERALAQELTEISEFNLGSLNLATMNEMTRAQFFALAGRAPQFARDELPDTPHKAAIVRLVGTFADMARADELGEGDRTPEPPRAPSS